MGRIRGAVGKPLEISRVRAMVNQEMAPDFGEQCRRHHFKIYRWTPVNISDLDDSIDGPSASSRFAESVPVLNHAFVELELNRYVAVLPSIVVNKFVSRIVVGIERLIEVRGYGVDLGSHSMDLIDANPDSFFSSYFGVFWRKLGFQRCGNQSRRLRRISLRKGSRKLP
jgi:hypothetical protein